jgi:Domain of unknown function (DUF222)
VSGVCDGQKQPSSVTEALGMLDRALDHLTAADTASLPTAVQAEALRVLERTGAKHTAARARMLAAFAGQAGYENDGHGSARTWLAWQTRVTNGAAAGAVGWVRRIADHPVIGEALAAGDLSESWARQVCAWTDRLPLWKQGDADEILAAAAGAGVDLAGLCGLAQEMYERAHIDRDHDVPDGFGDRAVWLGTTIGGAGRLAGDLTSGCAAALAAVLESLGKRAGPEDIRTAAQRRHDALEEACRRLVAAGMLPDRAGQPTQVQLYLTLSQLRGLPGASAAEAAWAAHRAAQPGWLTGPAAEAAACDATVVPVVTGQVDWAALDRLTGVYLASKGLPADGSSGCGCTCGGCTCPARRPLSPETLARLRQTMLRLAADVLSGTGGLASWLRTTQLSGGPGGSPSLPLAVPLPLDTGEAEPTIPAHLRRAVLARHQHCTWPGCRVPAAYCQIHHYVRRAAGGSTALGNLGPVCAFHHLTVVHRWGWTLSLHPDGEVTATSPDGTRTLHDHDAPAEAARASPWRAQIQLRNHIRAAQELNGMTWPARTG